MFRDAPEPREIDVRVRAELRLSPAERDQLLAEANRRRVQRNALISKFVRDALAELAIDKALAHTAPAGEPEDEPT